MAKNDTINGILVNADSFDFKDITLKYLDSIRDFDRVLNGKGFDKKKFGYADSYVQLCTLFDTALSSLDSFVYNYSLDYETDVINFYPEKGM